MPRGLIMAPRKLTITHMAKAAKRLRLPLILFGCAAIIDALANLVTALR
jgi:hypothetical protein